MRKLLYLFLLVSLAACGQMSNDKIKSEIKNTKTSKHINIPGTRLYIIPPSDFKVASSFVGLQKNANSYVVVYDLVGGNFYTNGKTFNKEGFEQQGLKVFDYKEIKVNGYPAKFITLQGNALQKAYGLLFGDSTFSTMIMGTNMNTDDVTGKEVIRALNTIFYDKNKRIDPFDIAGFTLDTTGSKFKFFKYAANVYLYSIGGVDNNSDDDAPTVMISQIPRDNNATSKSVADIMMGSLVRNGFGNMQMKNITESNLNGHDTYEMEVTGTLHGKPSFFYYYSIMGADMSVVFQGKAGDESQLGAFKNLARTLRVIR